MAAHHPLEGRSKMPSGSGDASAAFVRIFDELNFVDWRPVDDHPHEGAGWDWFVSPRIVCGVVQPRLLGNQGSTGQEEERVGKSSKI